MMINERATRLAKQLKESQHSISSNGVVKQIILTNIGEYKIDVNITGMNDEEIIFVLAMALIRNSKKLGLTEATLNESMSYLWEAASIGGEQQ